MSAETLKRHVPKAVAAALFAAALVAPWTGPAQASSHHEGSPNPDNAIPRAAR